MNLNLSNDTVKEVEVEGEVEVEVEVENVRSTKRLTLFHNFLIHLVTFGRLEKKRVSGSEGDEGLV